MLRPKNVICCLFNITWLATIIKIIILIIVSLTIIANLSSIIVVTASEQSHLNNNKSGSTVVDVTTPPEIESFLARYRFKLKEGGSGDDHQTTTSNYYSLPKWFYYPLYLSHYNKTTSYQLGQDEDTHSRRGKIYLQTALKVLDYRARFRANKTSSLVFINELSDLTNDELSDVTSFENHGLNQINNSTGLSRRDNCCTYEQAIKKLKLYYQLSDRDLRQGIIDEITEKALPVVVTSSKSHLEPLPFSQSHYHRKLTSNQMLATRLAIEKQQLTREPRLGTTNHSSQPPNQSKDLNLSGQSIDATKHQEEANKSQQFAAVYEQNNKGSLTLPLMESWQLAKKDKEPSGSSSNGSSLIDRGPWATTNKGLASRQTADRFPSNGLGKNNNGLLGLETEDVDVDVDVEEEEAMSKEKKKKPLHNSGNSSENSHEDDDDEDKDKNEQQQQQQQQNQDQLESSIQQAIQDQIVEQMKSQVGEQLRHTFSKHFGRPVVVRPRQFYTITTTPFPDNVMFPAKRVSAAATATASAATIGHNNSSAYASSGASGASGAGGR